MDDSIDTLISEIYMAGAAMLPWSAPLRRLAELTQSRHALIQANTLTPPHDLLFAYEDGHMDPEFVGNYINITPEIGDPRVRYGANLVQAGQLDAVYQDHDFIEPRNMARDSYYAEAMTPFALKYAVCTPLKVSADLVVGMSVHQDPRSGPADGDVVNLIRRARVHFIHALDIHAALGFRQGASIQDVSPFRVPTNGCFIDREGRLLSTCSSLEREVLQTGLARLNRGRLQPVSARVQCAFQRALSVAARGQVAQLALSETVQVRVVPVPEEEPGVHFPAERLILTIGASDRNSVQRVDERATRSFGLTNSEAAVAERLTCGDSIEEIAEHRNVSVATVRTQTKSIFRKMKVHSQREVVSKLASRPSA